MLTAHDYLEKALAVASTAAATQQRALSASAKAISDTLERRGRLWIFGSGHSHMMAEEIWGRAGGLVDVHPILEPSLMLHEGLEKSSLFERLTGLAEEILAVHPVQAGDCLIVVSNSGRNAVPVELATLARDRGATVIALTSLQHSRSVASRAPSGARLFEEADIVIDNCGVPGDAVVPHQPNPLGPTSSVVGALLLQALMVEVVGCLDSRGIPVETFVSLNVGK